MDTAAAVEALAFAGVAAWPELVTMLAEFDGLTFTSLGRKVRMDAVWCADLVHPDVLPAYERLSGCRLAPVGKHEHTTVLYGGDGAFWGGFDSMFGWLGDSVPDLLRGTIAPGDGRMLDMEVPDWTDSDD